MHSAIDRDIGSPGGAGISIDSAAATARSCRSVSWSEATEIDAVFIATTPMS